MTLTMITIMPSVLLLIYIYKKDKKEKEPMKLLMGCLFMGVILSIPAVILETLEDYVLDAIMTPGSVVYGFLDAFIVAALSEELFKYIFLKKKTWKSKHFDCSFDGIVYAVFVSLGFATFENIFYVFDGGLETAVLRMFTSIPGHMCFSVFMGYYYSKAKMASVKGNKKEEKSFLSKALWIPVILHGFYDFPLMMEAEVAGDAAVTIGLLFWIVYVIALFVTTFIFVNKASKNDDYILFTQDDRPVMTSSSFVQSWNCQCGAQSLGNFCGECGRRRPLVDVWRCPRCGTMAHWNFCAECGFKNLK